MFKNIKLRKALIGAGLGVLGVGAVVGTTWSINHFISQKQNVNDIEDLTPGTPIIDGVEAGDNDAVHEMPKQITFTRYSKVATSNNTLTVTCSVLPENTANKKLTWTLAWQDGANHGTVTGGTLQGNVVIDQVAFTLTDNGGDTRFVDNYIDAYNNPLVSSSTTFGQYIEANYASLTYSEKKFTSARDAFNSFTCEGVGYLYVKYHLVYSGTTYKTVSTYSFALKNYDIDFSSKLTATSLSLNDTSFIF